MSTSSSKTNPNDAAPSLASALPLIPMLIAAFVMIAQRVLALFSRSPTTPLVFKFSPNELNFGEMVTVYAMILWRWGLSLAGWGGKGKFVSVDVGAGAGAKAGEGRGGEKEGESGSEGGAVGAAAWDPSFTHTFWHHPSPLRATMPLIPSTLPSLTSSFARSLGLSASEAETFTLRTQHVLPYLAAATTPALLLLLASRHCPIQLLGCVNTRNEFEVCVEPGKCLQLLRPPVRVDAKDGKGGRVIKGGGVEMEVRVMLERDAVKRKRGWEYMVLVEVWEVGRGREERVVFREKCWFLEFAKHEGGAPGAVAGGGKEAEPDFGKAATETAPTTISFKTSDPWLWAKACKDYNAIHISSLAAKLFGLRAACAHGNHVLARMLHAEQKVMRKCVVEFKRPVFLPAKLTIKTAEEGKKIGGFVGEKLAVLVSEL